MMPDENNPYGGELCGVASNHGNTCGRPAGHGSDENAHRNNLATKHVAYRDDKVIEIWSSE